MWDIFKAHLFKLQEKYIPKKILRKDKKINKIWMNKDIDQLRHETYKNLKKMKTLQTNESILLYKKTLSRKKNEIQKNKRLKELELSNKSKDFKEFYKYFNNISKSTKTIGPLIRNENLVKEDQEMAEILNQQFSSVFTRDKFDNIAQNYSLPPSKSIIHPFQKFFSH